MRWKLCSIVFLMGALVHQSVATAATDAMPDLGMARVTDIRLNKTSDGRSLLRFSTTIVNVGTGPFELSATRSSTDGQWSVSQRIADINGLRRSVATNVELIFGGDGHMHWHIKDLLATDLIRLDNGSKVGTSAKLGYCFWDNIDYKRTLAGFPKSPVYDSSGCGVQSSTEVTMGLSVGWGDRYSYFLPDQYIDITNLTPGRYRLNVVADAIGMFAESNEANNGTWVDLQIKSNGGPRILGYGPAA
jgi:hypothetical protein